MAPSGLRQVLDLAFANSAHGRPSISTALRELIFDRDAIFNGRVLSTVTALGLRLAKTAYRSPWKNGIAERWVGRVRSELFDRAVIFNERHLRRLLGEYVAYYHGDRTHYALEKETPGGRLLSSFRRH